MLRSVLVAHLSFVFQCVHVTGLGSIMAGLSSLQKGCIPGWNVCCEPVALLRVRCIYRINPVVLRDKNWGRQLKTFQHSTIISISNDSAVMELHQIIIIKMYIALESA